MTARAKQDEAGANANANAGAKKFAIESARLADESHCEEILVLDLRGISPVTEYFVIATGTSDRQMRGIADDMAARGKTTGHKVWHVAGRDGGDWIVLDFVDVVVHLFNEQLRHYYDLELIWGEAPHVEWRRPSEAKTRS